MLHQLCVTLIRWFFILLLSISGAAKLLDLIGFFAVIETFKILPTVVIPTAAFGLALLELALAAWLILGTTQTSRKTAAALVMALHIGYFIWLAVAYARGLQILNCGCFGVYWPRPLTLGSLVEDSVLIVLALYLYISLAMNKNLNYSAVRL
jgi:hypothetical protein